MRNNVMRIVVDHRKCSGLGMCEAEAPGLFEVQHDGSLSLLIESPSGEYREQAEAAVAACPTEALSIAED
jgi:ferredoxin